MIKRIHLLCNVFQPTALIGGTLWKVKKCFHEYFALSIKHPSHHTIKKKIKKKINKLQKNYKTKLKSFKILLLTEKENC